MEVQEEILGDTSSLQEFLESNEGTENIMVVNIG